MPTREEKIAQFQEISNRGIQDHLPPEKRAIYDEVLRRGLITAQPAQEQPESFTGAGVIEPLATVASGAIAEPLAGLAGIAQGINPFAEPGAGAQAVEATREALTFQPRTQAGQEGLQAVGSALAPVGEAIESASMGLGDATLEATGSPALAAAVSTLPALAIELAGVKGMKGSISAAAKAKKAAAASKISREIADAAPTIDQIKDASRSVFKEIDNLGASVKPKAYETLVNNLETVTKKGGLRPLVTKKAAAAMDAFRERVGDTLSLDELDELRTVAQNVAKSIEPAEASLGVRMIETVDGFLDNAGVDALSIDPQNAATVGKRYKIARELWGRARRSEMLEEAFDKARLQASGFENGITVQFRQILTNKKKRKFFKPDELKEMRRVVEGDKAVNLAKLVGRLGFSEGKATNILGGLGGVAAGSAVGGTAGAVLVPMVGQVSRKLAQRMTAGRAMFADQVVRAGADAKKITKAYLKNTAKAERSAEELSQLLLRPDIDLNFVLSRSPKAPRATSSALQIGKEAAEIAKSKRAALSGIAAGTAAETAPQQIPEITVKALPQERQ